MYEPFFYFLQCNAHIQRQLCWHFDLTANSTYSIFLWVIITFASPFILLDNRQPCLESALPIITQRIRISYENLPSKQDA